MGETKAQIDNILHDFKNSWYFRIWAILFLICFIMFWVTVGVFSERAKSPLDSYRVSIRNESAGVNYPIFQFRIPDSDTGTSFNSSTIICKAGLLLLKPEACAGVTVLNTCFAINTIGLISAQGVEHNQGKNRVSCSFSILPGKNLTNRMVAWEIEGEDDIDPNDSSALWIAPTSNAWVVLQKSIVRQHNDDPKVLWNKQLVYHSTQAASALDWQVSVVFGSFIIFHYDTFDYYNGWMSFADIGGSMFFLSILVSVVLIFVGFVFTNDSKFLKGGEPGPNSSSYSTL